VCGNTNGTFRALQLCIIATNPFAFEMVSLLWATLVWVVFYRMIPTATCTLHDRHWHGHNRRYNVGEEEFVTDADAEALGFKDKAGRLVTIISYGAHLQFVFVNACKEK
jgi:hypothetical protein